MTMITTTVSIAALKALALFTTKEEGRWALNTIQCDCIPDRNETRLSATTGNCLVSYRADYSPAYMPAPTESVKPYSFLIPASVVAGLDGTACVSLSIDTNDLSRTLTLTYASKKNQPMTIQVNADDGRFPDLDRVFPQAITGKRECDYNPEYLCLFLKAAKLLSPRKKGDSSGTEFHNKCRLYHNGTGPALIEFVHDPRFTGFIMPLRDKGQQAPNLYWLNN